MKVIKDLSKLRSVAAPMEFTPENKNKINKLIRDMTDTYYNWFDKQCQGLAAIQIGFNESCILLQFDKTKENDPIIVFNPKVLLKIGFKLSLEGCVSEGATDRWYVWRPLLCKVQYQEANGEIHKEWLTYKKARVFCHEYDHTRGVLLHDKGVLHVNV